MCKEETLDTRNAFWSLMKKPEDRSHIENAAEIKSAIRMGIGEISCVPEFTGSCGEKFVSCC
jgi:hypothetical protein